MHGKLDRAAAGNHTRHLEQLRHRPRAARPHWTRSRWLVFKLSAHRRQINASTPLRPEITLAATWQLSWMAPHASSPTQSMMMRAVHMLARQSYSRGCHLHTSTSPRRAHGVRM